MDRYLSKIPIKSIVGFVLHRHLLLVLLLAPLVLGFSLLKVLQPIGDSGPKIQQGGPILEPPSFNPNQETLIKIQELSDPNINVEANFSENRINPFEN